MRSVGEVLGGAACVGSDRGQADSGGARRKVQLPLRDPMRPIDPRPVPTAGREDEQVHKTAILEGLTAGVKSAFKCEGCERRTGGS